MTADDLAGFPDPPPLFGKCRHMSSHPEHVLIEGEERTVHVCDDCGAEEWED